MTRVSVGSYTLELPPNGVAILYEEEFRLPGGIGYLEALVQFAGEVVRLRAMLDAMPAKGQHKFISCVRERK